MSAEVVGIIGIGAVVFLLIARMWIGLAMATVGFLGIAYLRGLDSAFGVLGTVPYKYVAFYPISAIPLFVFMAMVISAGRARLSASASWRKVEII